MDQERFDEIAKALASGTSRRAVLRRLGGVLGGALGLGASGSLAAPTGDGGGKPQGRCGEGFTNCRGTCVDLLGDRDNCGACATACPDVTVCQGGTCVCPNAGETYIGGACYDLASDPRNCGGVGEVCSGSTPYCVAGACVECTANSDCAESACLGNVCMCVPFGESGCSYSTNPDIARESCCKRGDSVIYCNPDGVCGGPGAFCPYGNHCASGFCDVFTYTCL